MAYLRHTNGSTKEQLKPEGSGRRQDMEIVGGIASVAQLLAYSRVAAQRLVQLYKATQNGPVFCRTQRSNIVFLLESIQRICIDEAPNADTVLPLLIATADLATSLLNLLKPKGPLYNHWLWVTKGQEIEDSFCALNDKTRLLQLHVTERIYKIVSHVHQDIKNMSQKLKKPPSQVDKSPPTPDNTIVSRTFLESQTTKTTISASSAMNEAHRSQEGHVKIAANENKAKDKVEQRIAGGWGNFARSADVNANKNEAEGNATQDVANAGAGSERNCEIL